MRLPDDRWAELVAAALAGELTPAEAEEFERARRDDPARAAEARELGDVAHRLRQGDVAWTSPRDTVDLQARIVAAVAAEGEDGLAQPDHTVPTRRDDRPAPARRWRTPLLAAACLAGGVAIGLGAPSVLTPTPSGPPGTLGVVEAVDVRDDRAGIDVDADVVAHTWGTEAYLEARGLDVGATYEVVFVGADGADYSAGEILGSEVPIVCRMNAAVLRGDAIRLEVRDTESVVIAHADLPSA